MFGWLNFAGIEIIKMKNKNFKATKFQPEMFLIYLYCTGAGIGDVAGYLAGHWLACVLIYAS